MTLLTIRRFFRRIMRVVWPAITCAVISFAGLLAQTLVTLQQTASPAVAESGLTTVSVTGINFPTVTIAPANITVTLSPQPPAIGPTSQVPATTVANLAGNSKRVSFRVPSLVISQPTAYLVTIADSVQGQAFTSGNSANLTINPPAAIQSVTPNSGQTGTTVGVTIQGLYSNFFSGTSVVNAGVGITVQSVVVVSPTVITALFVIAPTAQTGPETVAVTTASETASLANAFTVQPGPPAVTLTSPTNLSFLNLSPTTVNGTVSNPTATVVVNSIPAPVSNGAFSIALPLAEGPNIITATATTAGGVGTASITVMLDTTPPHVTITSPPDQFTTTGSSISVAGSINDIVVGTVNPQQATVSVNGTAAQVSNRTFLATNVPLNLGSNIIQAVGRDRAGNAATTQITVIRQSPLQQPQITLVSGNNQTGTIGSVLSAPLVVALTDASGKPVSTPTPVIFKVIQNNGLVASGASPAASVVATTNAQSQAQAQWTLGMRAGAGGNTLEAFAVGFSGTAIFTATGNQGAAGNIVIDSGNTQIGVVNQPLPQPLIAVVVDAGSNRLANVPVTFTVIQGGGSFNGQSTMTTATDSDGRVAATLTLGLQEGNSNNLIQASFAGNQAFPASFTASGRAEGPAANTVISGVVLDNSNLPIPGVTIRALLTNVLNSNSSSVNSAASAQTNAQGQFTITQAPVGFVKLMVDGSTAQRTGTYPSLEYDMVTIAGQNNTLEKPVYLLPLNPANQLCVTATTGGGTLTIPEASGFSLTFGPGQVTFPGGSQTGCVSVTVVHPDKVPMTPGFGQQPRFIVTIQPTGAIFNPPAPISLPNVDGLQPRAVTEMYSFDHDIGSFVAIGTGTVSDDGQVIRSNMGVGVLKAGWHCGGNPTPSGAAATCGPCAFCNGTICIPNPTQGGNCQNPCLMGRVGQCNNGSCTGPNLPPGTPCNGTGQCISGQCVFPQCPGICNSGNPCVIDGCSQGLCTTTANPACQKICAGQPPNSSCLVGGVAGNCQNGQCQVCSGLLNGTPCVSGGQQQGSCQNGVCQGNGNQCSPLCNGGACVNGGCCPNGNCNTCNFTVQFSAPSADGKTPTADKSFVSQDALTFLTVTAGNCPPNSFSWSIVGDANSGSTTPATATGPTVTVHATPPSAPTGRTSPLSYTVTTTDGQTSNQILVITQDAIDKIRQQYVDMETSIGLVPSRVLLGVVGLPIAAVINRTLFSQLGSQHFTFAEIQSHDGAPWALFQVFPQMDAWWTAAHDQSSIEPGDVGAVVSRGYSTPEYNYTSVDPDHPNSPHIYGVAVDLDTTPTNWDLLSMTLPSPACMEIKAATCPPEGKCHFHADWRNGSVACAGHFQPK